uniref:Nucleolar protein 6 n=1 Tax=Hirondellea gigas TaxID=1518452 RepID=A0A2P2I6Y2_9CRUS
MSFTNFNGVCSENDPIMMNAGVDHLYTLEMKELLSNINMSEKCRLRLTTWLTSFRKFLKAIPAPDEPVPLCDSSSYTEQGVQMPLRLPPNIVGSFKFAAPTNVAFTGSFQNGTATTQNSLLDLLIEVPKSCLGKLDNRDGRWLIKRAHYLAHLATELNSCELLHTNSISWSLHMGEPLRPVLVVTPKLGNSEWKLQLLPVPAVDAFKVHSFAPNKQNIKHTALPCSQVLNFLCCVDTNMRAANKEVETTLQQQTDSHSVSDGIKLLKVWLQQRQLYKGQGSFSGHIITQLVLYLHKLDRIGPQMSPFQIFRIVLAYLESECNWTEAGISLHDAMKQQRKRYRNGELAVNPLANTIISTAQFLDLYPAVFVDSSGYLNIAAALTPQLFKQLQQEARSGLQILNSNTADSFELLFIKRVDFNLAFDQRIHVLDMADCLRKFYSPDTATTLPLLLNQLHPQVYGENDQDSSSSSSSEEEEDYHPVGEVAPLLPELCQLLTKGLGARATLVMHKLEPPKQWNVTAKLPDKLIDVVFGIKVDPTTAWSLLIKDTEDKPAEFRDFWGEKSQLRRYHDGSFCESVMWGTGTDPQALRMTIPGNIAKYLMCRHFGIPEKHVVHVGPSLDTALMLAKSSQDYQTYSTGEEGCVTAVKAYDTLCDTLRKLQLPLPVSSIASSSPVLAQAQLYTRNIIRTHHTALEQVNTMQTMTDPVEVLVFLGRSGKWPQDLDRVNCVRMDFHREIVKQLRSKKLTAVLDNSYVYVAVNGFSFKVRVTYQGEVLLLRRLGSPQQVQRDGAAAGEEEEEDEDVSIHDTADSLQLQIQTTVTPRIMSALAGLGRQHNSYSACVRLCRRWVSSHMLEPYMPGLVTQLLVAHMYLQPAPFQVPHTPYVGLMRFLTVLSTTDWSMTPFFLDLLDDFHEEDLKELRSQFMRSREALPALFLATNFDIRGGHHPVKEAGGVDNLEQPVRNFRYKLVSEWSRKYPSRHVLSLLQQLATAVLENIQDIGLDPDYDIFELFIPNTSFFDLTIHLKTRRVPHFDENIELCAGTRKPMHSSGEAARTFKYNNKMSPKTIVQRLRTHYREDAYVMYDENGGAIIGLCFNPGALEERIIADNDYLLMGMELLSRSSPMRGQLSLEAAAAAIQSNYSFIVQSVTLNASS